MSPKIAVYLDEDITDQQPCIEVANIDARLMALHPTVPIFEDDIEQQSNTLEAWILRENIHYITPGFEIQAISGVGVSQGSHGSTVSSIRGGYYSFPVKPSNQHIIIFVS